MKYLIKQFFHHYGEATQYNRNAAQRNVLHCRSDDLHLKDKATANAKY